MMMRVMMTVTRGLVCSWPGTRHCHVGHHWLHGLLLDVWSCQVAVLLVAQVGAGGHGGQGLINRGQLTRVFLVKFHRNLLKIKILSNISALVLFVIYYLQTFQSILAVCGIDLIEVGSESLHFRVHSNG